MNHSFGIACVIFMTLAGAACGSSPNEGAPDSGTSDASGSDARTPVAIGTLVQIAAGAMHACARTSTNAVLCWGSSDKGVTGRGDYGTPGVVPQLPTDLVSIASGDWRMCGVTTSGTPRCWSSDSGGFTTNTQDRIGEVKGVSGVTAIAAGNEHFCAITSAKRVVCWGSNRHGALGRGTITEESLPPDEVPGLADVESISLGDQSTCVVLTAGGLRCWGRNLSGEVGDGSKENRAMPTAVTGFETSGATAVAAGSSMTCAVTAAGGAKCWGANDSGKLGTGTGSESLVPTDVLGLTDVVALSVRHNNAIALLKDGTVKSWGFVGFDLQQTRMTPETVALPVSDVTSVGAGAYHQCALSATGRAFCWGGNADGQLGNLTTTDSLTPVEVVLPKN